MTALQVTGVLQNITREIFLSNTFEVTELSGFWQDKDNFCFVFILFYLGFLSYKAEQPLQGME